jgi:hypothetical protein
VEGLWRHLEGVEALAVVHPTESFDWRSAYEGASRRLLEIHAGVAHREHESLADVESAGRRPPGRTRRGAHEAWAAGLQLGVTASSGDHTGRPGRRRGGLTAVVASALTREAVFAALEERRTYATTGERIVLDFAVSGVPMGGVVDLHGVASGTFEIASPTPLRFVEVVAYDHRDRWWTVVRWNEPGRLLASGFVDTPELPTLYYLRAELAAPSGERAGRAWSSPVWVRPVDTAP